MCNNYQIVSPSLEGVLDNAEQAYGGIKRPVEILRILDGPQKDMEYVSERDREALSSYYQDLCAVFLKKFSTYVLEDKDMLEDSIRLQAIFQEIIKVKKLKRDF